MGWFIKTNDRKFVGRIVSLVSVVGISLIFLPTVASASTYGSGNYGACQYGSCSISITSNGSSSGTVSLNVTPTTGGTCTVQSNAVQVMTDDSSGYTLTMTNNGTNTALLNGSSTIPATSGTISSPIALTSNTWGYRVDGAGSFGSGPTTAQTNASPSSLTFAGPVASNLTPDTIANTSTAADPPVTTTVWFGVCANLATTNGTYTSQVTYTAVTN